MLNLIDVSSVTENGNFYPILLLCLKELEALKGQVGTLTCKFVFFLLPVDFARMSMFAVFSTLCLNQIDFQFSSL